MQFLKKFIKNKRISFYVTCAVALLSIISSFVYLGSLLSLNKYFSWWVFALPLIGGILYFALSLINEMRIGTIIMAILFFASIILFALSIYQYPMNMIMSIPNLFDIPKMGMIITIAVMFIFGAVASNVLAWIPQKKNDSSVK